MAYADAATTRWNSNLQEISQPNQEMGQDRFSGDENILMTTGYRGTTSPWTALVSGTSLSSGSESMRSFQETAERLAEEDSLSKNQAPVRFDILHEFPFLARENIYFYAKNYADAAPFPILHWENFRNSLDLILRTRHAVRSGQVVCILLVNSLLPSIISGCLEYPPIDIIKLRCAILISILGSALLILKAMSQALALLMVNQECYLKGHGHFFRIFS